MNVPQIGVYWESWDYHSLLTIEKAFNVVYLSFATPECYYVKGSRNFYGTGLNFQESFEGVVAAISNLQERNIEVYLAVGGASYWSAPRVFHAQPILDLMEDLQVDGIDFDWEVGVLDSRAPILAIKAFRKLSELPISYTCFSTGAYPPRAGDRFMGMNIRTLKECGDLIDNVNIMAYDAGKNFDEHDTFKAYQNLYEGPINLGFQIGVQGWGDAILYESEARENLQFTADQGYLNGCFLWSHHKVTDKGIDVEDFGALAVEIFKKPTPPTPATTGPVSLNYQCINCNYWLQIKVCSSLELLPSNIIDLGVWSLTIPDKHNTNHPGMVYNPYLKELTDDFFKVSPTGNSVLFSCNAGAATTNNSQYPRTELREMDGSEKASWSSRYGYHEMMNVLSINAIPLVRSD